MFEFAKKSNRQSFPNYRTKSNEKNYYRLYNGPVSIHYEYDLGGAESGKVNPVMSLDKISFYLKNDLKWFRAKIEQHKI
jgi:hypothetical protein